nr:gpn-loop gtpase 2 [Quercus suber]
MDRSVDNVSSLVTRLRDLVSPPGRSASCDSTTTSVSSSFNAMRSGKSTLCNGLQQFTNAISRPCSVANLDPANDNIPYTPDFDVRDLVEVEEVMDREELGPNGGVLWAMEEVDANFDWIEEKLADCEDLIILDPPGQPELTTHHEALPRILQRIEKLGYRIDNLKSVGGADLPFNLDFYTEVQDLSQLLPALEAEQRGLVLSDSTRGDGAADHTKFSALNSALISLVEDFGLVGFETLAVEDKASMASLLHAVDRASGYAFAGARATDEDGRTLNDEASVWAQAMSEQWQEDLIILDPPGQPELTTHHEALPRILQRIEKLGYRIDNLKSVGGADLPFNLDFYTEVQDLSQLLPALEAEQRGLVLSDSTRGDGAADHTKFSALNSALISLVEDFGLVGFETLAVEDKASMASLLHAVDRASGYAFAGARATDEDGRTLNDEASVWAQAMSEQWQGKMDIRDVQERWIERKEEIDEAEQKAWEEEARLAGALPKEGAAATVRRVKPDPTKVAKADIDIPALATKTGDEEEEDELLAAQAEWQKQQRIDSDGTRVRRIQ